MASSPETGPPGYERISTPPPATPPLDSGPPGYERISTTAPPTPPLDSAPPGYERLPTPQQQPPPVDLTPPSLPERPTAQQTNDTEVGQMVCGSCRELLTYPRGAKNVQCPCCHTINFVLEAHEVGNVECGKCKVLLMYPYGASRVRCSRCRYVTRVGAHNIRPRASELQGILPPPPNPVQ